MYCVKIKEWGCEDDRLLFFYDGDKAVIKIKELLQKEINYYVGDDDDDIDLNFDFTSYNAMQSILNTVIRHAYNSEEYDYKYHITLSKIAFEDEDVC
jgi:hypothetical protein